jgi:hypothetical protein
VNAGRNIRKLAANRKKEQQTTPIRIVVGILSSLFSIFCSLKKKLHQHMCSARARCPTQTDSYCRGMLEVWYRTRPGVLYAMRHKSSPDAIESRQRCLHPSYEVICSFMPRLIDVMMLMMKTTQHINAMDEHRAELCAIDTEAQAQLARAYFDDYIGVCSRPSLDDMTHDCNALWQQFAMACRSAVPLPHKNGFHFATFNTFQLLRASVACCILSMKMYCPTYKLNAERVSRQVQCLLLQDASLAGIGRCYDAHNLRRMSDRRRQGQWHLDETTKRMRWSWNNRSRRLRSISVHGQLFLLSELARQEEDVLRRLQWHVLPQKYNLTP